MSQDSPKMEWLSRVLMILLALGILLPSLWGFGNKLLEFVALARGEADGAFAVTPLANYLLASAGFLLLFCWAALNGMFHDIERPKHAMLENEKWLEQHYDSGRLH
jgi:nitrogen fixation-related uncharacterized protein